MIITIDGPAGSGKSTAARKLAALLGIPYLDTGAMYRAITLKALDTRTSIDDSEALERLARSTDLQLDCNPTDVRVRMDGRDVSEAIRSMRVSQHTSQVAQDPGVRRVLVEKQRQIGRKLGSLIAEGRDQGSVVFPDADVQFLVEADDKTRAERRLSEMRAEGEDVDFEAVLSNIRERDRNDKGQWEPLFASDRTIRIDTTTMTVTETVERMRQEVERHCPRKSSQA